MGGQKSSFLGSKWSKIDDLAKMVISGQKLLGSRPKNLPCRANFWGSRLKLWSGVWNRQAGFHGQIDEFDGSGIWGHFWGLSGLLGQFWAIFGDFGAQNQGLKMGHFWGLNGPLGRFWLKNGQNRKWRILTSFLTKSDLTSQILAIFGAFWENGLLRWSNLGAILSRRLLANGQIWGYGPSFQPGPDKGVVGLDLNSHLAQPF